MLATGGGAWYFPPQAAIKASRAILFMVFSSVMVSKPGAGDHGDREARKRVLEDVFESAVVEQVLDLDVEPDRSHGAHAGSGVEEQLAADEGGVEGVSRQRGGEAYLPVTFDAVAPVCEAREHPMGRAVGQAVPVAPVHGVEEAVGELAVEVGRERDEDLEFDSGDAGMSDVEWLHPRRREQLIEDEVAVVGPERVT